MAGNMNIRSQNGGKTDEYRHIRQRHRRELTSDGNSPRHTHTDTQRAYATGLHIPRTVCS